MTKAEEAVARLDTKSLLGMDSVMQLHDSLKYQFHGQFRLSSMGTSRFGVYNVEFLFNDHSALRISYDAQRLHIATKFISAERLVKLRQDLDKRKLSPQEEESDEDDGQRESF